MSDFNDKTEVEYIADVLASAFWSGHIDGHKLGGIDKDQYLAKSRIGWLRAAEGIAHAIKSKKFKPYAKGKALKG